MSAAILHTEELQLISAHEACTPHIMENTLFVMKVCMCGS